MNLQRMSYPKKQLIKSRFLFFAVLILAILVSAVFLYKGWRSISLNIMSVVFVIGIFFGILYVFFWKFVNKRADIFMNKIERIYF